MTYMLIILIYLNSENGHGILFDDRKRLLRDEIQDSDWEERIRTGIVAAELRKSERGG